MKDDEAIPATKRWPNRPRLAAFDYTGAHAYHLVFNTARHQPLLIGALAEVVVDAIRQAAAATSFELLVYTVMPNHVHLLVRGTTDSANVVRLVQRCKQKPGFLYKRDTGNQLGCRASSIGSSAGATTQSRSPRTFWPIPCVRA